MAIPVIDFGVVKRAEGRSSIGGAAYMAGRHLYDQTTQIMHNHSGKQDVFHSEILAPVNSPNWCYDQKELWNKVEKSERWKTAQVAREGYAALPRELSKEQNIELARAFLTETFVAIGMVVDFAFHDSQASDGGRNPHIHFQMTMREVDIEADGFCKKKNREWNCKFNVSVWRKAFERSVNAALENADSSSRIDMRSYSEQGLAQKPMVHMGKIATELERKGVLTRLGDINRKVRIFNMFNTGVKAIAKVARNSGAEIYNQIQGLFYAKPSQKSEAENSHALHAKYEKDIDKPPASDYQFEDNIEPEFNPSRGR